MDVPPDRLAALVVEFERLFRERTPAKSVMDVLASSRVTFTDMADWYWRTYGESLPATARLAMAPALKPVFRRLRREFPDDRWD